MYTWIIDPTLTRSLELKTPLAYLALTDKLNTNNAIEQLIIDYIFIQIIWGLS